MAYGYSPAFAPSHSPAFEGPIIGFPSPKPIPPSVQASAAWAKMVGASPEFIQSVIDEAKAIASAKPA